ncbi:hypothetical protein F0562_009220 [Nyssa sinensis]|uniref:Expansin-like EG45 domain-containing protein n=1 Tax=Nyssa sinensis TaxID=561372 RepID=A0A5J5A0B7_9ASTE|nr:hypothetical protein F0562_009220 [Nyssa sinensis]
MGFEMRVLIMVGMLICLTSLVYANPIVYKNGTATYYGPPYVPSACYGNQSKGVFVAKVSAALWKNRTACGDIYKVKCTGPTNPTVLQPCKPGTFVLVKVVDYCRPPSCNATFDLSRNAFNVIAFTSSREINIEYIRR